MYTLAPVCERVSRIRNKYRGTKPKVCIERLKIVTNFYKSHPNITGILLRAENFKNLCEKMPVVINDDEIVVGSLTSMYHGSALFPEYSINWLFDEIKSGKFLKRNLDPYDIEQEAMDYILSTEEFWRPRSLSARMDAAIPDGMGKLLGNGVISFGIEGNCLTPVGHFCTNYDKAIRVGFAAIKKEAQQKMNALEGKFKSDDAKKYLFYKAIAIVCDGMMIFAKRYAGECRRLAEKAENHERKTELLKMADSLDWIVENPCRSFHEAVQCLFLYQIALALDGNLHGLTLGRVDQYLGSFYEKDLTDGKITPAAGQEILDQFFLKIAEMNKVTVEGVSYAIGGYTSGQIMTLGGVTKDGKDATNSVSYMMLQASSRLVLHDPPLALRIHKGTPAQLWEAAINTTKICGGVPTFENDDVIIPALVDKGMSLESARNYCLIGCVEPAGTGDEWPACGGPGRESFYNMANALLLAVNNGVNPLPGPDGKPRQQAGLATGYLYNMKTFDEVKEALKKQFDYFIDWQVSLTNLLEYVAAEYMPLPIVSATMDGCMEKGLDVMWGGAKYNSTGFGGIGCGNIADSLSAIKYLIYDKKKLTAKEFYDAFMNNWQGREPLRQTVLNEVPRFGNDNPYVDELASWAMGIFCDKVNSCTGPRGTYRAGLYPVAMHVLYGKMTAATPDGRMAHEPLADGISPMQGMDKKGPTAVLKSLAKIHQQKVGNGTLLNMRFHPKSLEGAQGVQKFEALMKHILLWAVWKCSLIL
ncbi:Trans-4-hydroxy-L-proline dehydratase [Sporomusa acidovorans DSM 3132]|uniref:Trans-4-hydroxy-L-proline dehydratase n=1 Tax=Sporomusa acidovorans (strain ATCC 49682 / DSM 3132 / Mol) TaxID=1123286 RepID=A0ABZ3J061_SPOA4|nr:pyruvate formate lyase family protein [Sporomusa acidovorans]OZC21313.1 benzylsuccinate synthase alpha subunit [Sporomusa acidovorans DSM 3132]SDF84274.1 formate C-acetyltransferase [Sporomusa acidovorans]